MIPQACIAVVGVTGSVVPRYFAVSGVVIGLHPRAGGGVDDVTHRAQLILHVDQPGAARHGKFSFGQQAFEHRVRAVSCLAYTIPAPEVTRRSSCAAHRLGNHSTAVDAVIGEHALVGAPHIAHLDQPVLRIVLIRLRAVAARQVAVSVMHIGVRGIPQIHLVEGVIGGGLGGECIIRGCTR